MPLRLAREFTLPSRQTTRIRTRRVGDRSKCSSAGFSLVKLPKATAISLSQKSVWRPRTSCTTRRPTEWAARNQQISVTPRPRRACGKCTLFITMPKLTPNTWLITPDNWDKMKFVKKLYIKTMSEQRRLETWSSYTREKERERERERNEECETDWWSRQSSASSTEHEKKRKQRKMRTKRAAQQHKRQL